MVNLKSLTIKNFMSIGNVTQTVTFDNNNLVLVLGENLDLGGNDNKNGTGKTTLVNALSYALFGTALTNIRKDNLVNSTNMKNMLVTISFEVNGIDYRIERGRKPGIFKFIKDGIESSTDEDESLGEGRHTQEEIEKIIGISHEMCKHILTLNTYVEPFLSLKTNDQREIIEQLLGITKLSEKADKLKEEIRITKDEIKEEEFRISATTETNRRIELNIKTLLDKSTLWENAKLQKINKIQNSITNLLDVNIDEEILSHKSKKEIEELTSEYRSLLKESANLEHDINDSTKSLNKLSRLLENSIKKMCPTCSQVMDNDTHEKVHNEYLSQKIDIKNKIAAKTIKHNDVKNLAKSVSSIIPSLPKTFYSTIDEAYNHKSILDNLGNTLDAELNSLNPYIDQIDSLRTTGLQEIDFVKLNTLSKLRDHQEFLNKLLINKDSFIRKKIIDQNLSFLNHQLSQYTKDIGLPHIVKFKSDLEVEISMLGKEYDFDNLSRGERTRLILALSWTFRDVYESMNDKINLLFIDELVDNGIDVAGTESVLKILKEMSRNSGKNIYLISHKEEFINRIPNILKVTKEGGFTTISSQIEEN